MLIFDSLSSISFSNYLIILIFFKSIQINAVFDKNLSHLALVLADGQVVGQIKVPSQAGKGVSENKARIDKVFL